MSPKINRRLFWLAILLIAIASLLSLALSNQIPALEPDPLAATLKRARDSGSYRFTSEVTQVTIPTSKVTNVGRSSHTDQLYLEGQTDLRTQSMHLRLWSQQGSVGDPVSGVAVKLEDGKTYVQEGLGAWREREGLVDSFAPQGDFMAFLSALRDPEAHDPETRNGISFTRYTFRLDGPALARYIRDLAEDTLQQRGELPSGMQAEPPAYYRDMVGDGELWVGSDGLPLRQILRMRFPEENDEVVQAEIVTNFSGFGQITGSLVGLSGWIDVALLNWRDKLTSALSLLAVLAFIALLLSGRGRIWRSLALALIFMLVFNPLMSDLQIAKAANAQATRLAEREQERAESRQRDELLAQMAVPKIDPHADPLQAVADLTSTLQVPPQQGFTTFLTSSTAPASRPSTIPAAQNDDPTDTDGDGLTDFEEESIGTDPTYFDTDEDGITDTIEIQGFYMDGNAWFMDPNEIDSNSDGNPDTVEYDFNQDGVPDDTDGDGLPDVFDYDNDGDGIPDAKDLSPFAVAPSNETYFTDENPFQLTINNLTAGVPTFVDFQIRPANENHLWYAYHVLDWPNRDYAGHIQDIDGVTFGTLPSQSDDPAPRAGDYNGDMKLIPMLEIRVPDNGTNLPPQEDLIPYNISINDYTEDGSQMVVYVPLSIITDEQTGARVAFNARMLYLPAGSWLSAHEVRLVWLVQVLNDMPCNFWANDPEEGCKADNYIHNVRQVVHSYSDDWKLTGLNLTEDHGASVAILYEDPLEDQDLKNDGALTALSAGLDETFLTGRDDDGDGQRDVDLDEIVRRFDRLSNDGVGIVERWGIADILRVERQDYESLDLAVMSTAMTETLRILNDNFAVPWASDQEIKPLLMYAQEAQSRTMGMDVMNNGEGWVTWDGSAMILDLNPAEHEANPLLLTVSLKWTPYCTLGTTLDWSPCAMDDWWETLEARYPGVLEGDPIDDPQIAAGRTALLNIYASVLMQGISSVVSEDGNLVIETGTLRTDEDLKGWLEGMGDVVKTITNTVMAERFRLGKTYTFVRHMGDILNAIKGDISKLPGKIKTLYKDFKYGTLNRDVKKSIAWIGVGVAVALTYMVVTAFLGVPIGKPIAFAWETFGSLGLKLYEGYKKYKQLMKFVKISNWRTGLQSFCKSNECTGKIGAVITGLIAWGFFMYSWLSGAVQFGSPEFNQILAETIAATIIIILGLIATGYGAIILFIVELIEVILYAVCKLGVDWLKTGQGCFSLSGFLANFLYNYSPMVEVDDLLLGAPHIDLSDPSEGLVENNSLSVSMPVTATVVYTNPDLSSGYLILPYAPWIFTKENLAISTLKYSLDYTKENITANLNEMKDDWEIMEDHKWGLIQMYRGQASTLVVSPDISLVAGVNRELSTYFNLGYALPAYECYWTWMIIWVPVCYIRPQSGGDSQEIDKLLLDVLPATLDGFMTMGGDEAAQKLSWDEKFAVLKDADGDGLLANSQGGMDPDDSTWDADGDGLSDAYELEQRQAGVAYSPTSCDTDGDGLTDLQEAQFGTAPDRVDSDRDGLLDGEEVIHERFNEEMGICYTYGVIEGGWYVQVSTSRWIRVQSNPLIVDSDGDGVSDLNERLYAQTPGLSLDLDGHPFHPNVPNVPWLMVTGEVSQDALLPGASLVYSTTAVTKVALDPSELDVVLPPALGGSTLIYNLPFDPVTFTETQTVTQISVLNVLPAATSQLTLITSTVHGLINNSEDILNVTAETDIRIDADPPSSTIDTLNNWQYVQGDSSMPVIAIIGGSASDNLTGVTLVELSVNNGPWQLADGTASWTFPLSAMDVGLSALDGAINIRTRATDGAGNVEMPGAGNMALVDGRPPEFTFQNTPTNPVVPGREACGMWTASLGGIIQDPTVGGSNDPYDIYAGSGVDPDSLLVRLRSNSIEDPVIGDWQPVALEGDQWSVVYQFPASVVDPTGAWIAEMLAADMVGNSTQAENSALLYVDSAAPAANLSAQDVARSVMSGTLTIGGLISDTLSGVDRLDVSFSPLEQVAPLSDAVLWLSFDEQANSAYWADRSGHGNDASCKRLYEEDTCPSTVSGGRIGSGLQISPSQRVSVTNAPELNIPAGAGFSVQAWIKPELTDQMGILYKEGAYELKMGEAGKVKWMLYDPSNPWSIVSSVEDDQELTSNTWHHVVGTFDPQTNPETGKIQLFVDGHFIGEANAPIDKVYTSEEPLSVGGTGFEHYTFLGVMDEVIIFSHALAQDEVQALYQAGARPWYPAGLTQNGSGVTQATWNVAVPEGLEGIYQIDLRGWDVLGNSRISAKAWRGTIDTWSPRLVLTTDSTGAAYIDPVTTERRVGVSYACGAWDTFLDESTFQCPGSNLPPPVRSFQQDPILQTLFPDLTFLNSLGVSWTQWQPPGVFWPSVSACDVFGNCATDTWRFAIDGLSLSGPTSAVISPTDQATIASNGTINVTVSAYAPKSLEYVLLALDGTTVNIKSFDKVDAVIFSQYVVPVSASEGIHTLVSFAKDWNNVYQLSVFPVQFTLDTHPPDVGISTTLITQNEVYHKGSPMLRFHGTASDTTDCPVAVQLRVGAGPYVNTNFNNGEWSIAYFVNAPEGQTLIVKARAIDCAGQITEVTRDIGTDLSAEDAPDTQITSTPTDPSGPDNVTFELQAIKVGKEVAGLMCRLDDELFTPCASPHTYNDLNGGIHTFYVRAIDVEGNVDETPASFTWTVSPAEQGSMIWLPLVLKP